MKEKIVMVFLLSILILHICYFILPSNYAGKHSDDKAARINNIICSEDKKRIDIILNGNDDGSISPEEFFKIIMFPVQMGCNNMKRLGGSWYVNGYDGSKYVCLDDFVDSEEPCLIYSFGIGSDVTFEQVITKYGCIIHGYDHTITEETRKELENPEKSFYIHHKGVDSKKEGNLTTFEDLLLTNGHLLSSITYLKVDIEAWEVVLLPAWLESGLLDRVRQVGVEFHAVQGDRIAEYFRIVQQMYKKGFRIISFDPNFYVGMQDKSYMTYFEILFRRPEMSSCLPDLML